MAYFPLARQISAITNSTIPTVTFTADHGYLVGQLLSFRVASDFVMFEINQRFGKVLSIPSTTSITIDIDTTTWGTFAVPGSTSQANSMTLPIGSGFIDESGIIKTNTNCAFDKRP